MSNQNNVYGNVYQFGPAGGGGSPLPGYFRTTVQVTDADSGNPIANVYAQVLTTEVATITDNNGQGAIDLVNGSYTIRVIPPPGYGSIADIPWTIDDSDETLVIQLTRLSVTPPPSNQLITVRCDVAVNGVPVTGAIVTARLRDQNSSVNADQTVASNVITEAVTQDGYAELILYRYTAFDQGDGVYVLQAKHENRVIWAVTSALPDADSVNLPELPYIPPA